MGRDEVGKVGLPHGNFKVLVSSLGIILRAIGSHGEFLKDLLSLDLSCKVWSWQPIRRCASNIHTASEDVGQGGGGVRY